MIRVFNKGNRLFQLESGSSTILVAPRKLLEIPEEFADDITFRMAVKSGDIEVIGETNATGPLAQIVKDAETDQKEDVVQHPDGLEETEAKRREAAATGRVRKKKE